MLIIGKQFSIDSVNSARRNEPNFNHQKRNNGHPDAKANHFSFSLGNVLLMKKLPEGHIMLIGVKREY